MKLGWILFNTWVFGAVCGNFSFQYFNNEVWMDAVERSYFQGYILLLAYVWLGFLERRDEYKRRYESRLSANQK